MSFGDVIKDCQIDGLFTVTPVGSRHYVSVIAIITDVASAQTDIAPGEDDADDSSDDGIEAKVDNAADMDDDDGGAGDDDADDGDAEGSVDFDGKQQKKKPKKRKKSKKRKKKNGNLPKRRVTLHLLNKVPLVHADARLRLRLRPRRSNDLLDAEAECDEYDVVECIRYKVVLELAYRTIRAALADPSRRLMSRRESIAAHQALRDAGLSLKFGKTNGFVKRSEVQLSHTAREKLNALGSDLAYPTTLGALQRAFMSNDHKHLAIHLELGLRNFYAIHAPLVIGYGDAGSVGSGIRYSILRPHVIAHALDVLTSSPYNATSSVIEQLSIAQLITCAEDRDIIDSMFVIPGRMTSDQDAVHRTLCRNDVVFHRWRLPKPAQLEATLMKMTTLSTIMKRVPAGCSVPFLSDAAEWYQRRATRFGATMFECGETQDAIDEAASVWHTQTRQLAELESRRQDAKKKTKDHKHHAATNDVEHADDSEELVVPECPNALVDQAHDQADDASEDLNVPGEHAERDDNTIQEALPSRMAFSRTQWLSEQCEFIRPAPDACSMKRATTPLYSTCRAAATMQSIGSAALSLDRRLVLFGVRAAGHGVGAVDDYVFTEKIVHADSVRDARLRHAGMLPLVVIVFLSVPARERFREWLDAHDAGDRFTLCVFTLEQLVVDGNIDWTVCMRVRLATRLVVVDAHMICEHDMSNLLSTFASNNEARGDVALCGELDGPSPDAHHESGAPFIDLWRSYVFRCEEFDGGTSCVRGYAQASPALPSLRLASALLDSAPARRELADEMSRCVATRVREVTSYLLDRAHTVQVCGNSRAALASGCAVLADYMQRYLAKPGVDKDTQQLNHLRLVAKEFAIWQDAPWRAEASVLKHMPYVRYQTTVFRVIKAYQLTREAERDAQVHIGQHLQEIGTSDVSFCLDTVGLYLRLSELAATLSDVDHRRCCFTTDRNLLSVGQHRHELRGASIMLARESARSVDCNLSNVCLLLLPNGDGSFNTAELDAEQLVVVPSRCHGTRVRYILPRATPDDVRRTFTSLTSQLGYFHYPPPTMLRAALRASYDARPSVVSRADDVECDGAQFVLAADESDMHDF